MKNFLWVAFAGVCILAVAALTLSFTVFTLNTAEINFVDQEGKYIDIECPEEVKDVADGVMGSSLVFLSTQNLTANIEKSNFWLKVVQIKKHYPNKINIVAVLRTPVFSFENDGKTYYLSEDGFVMDLSGITATKLIGLGEMSTPESNTYIDGVLTNAQNMTRAKEVLLAFCNIEGFSFQNFSFFATSMTFDESKIIIKTSIGSTLVINDASEDIEGKVKALYDSFVKNPDLRESAQFASGQKSPNGNYIVNIS